MARTIFIIFRNLVDSNPEPLYIIPMMNVELYETTLAQFQAGQITLAQWQAFCFEYLQFVLTGHVKLLVRLKNR